VLLGVGSARSLLRLVENWGSWGVPQAGLSFPNYRSEECDSVRGTVVRTEMGLHLVTQSHTGRRTLTTPFQTCRALKCWHVVSSLPLSPLHACSQMFPLSVKLPGKVSGFSGKKSSSMGV
jgi:hypothetical protein